MENINQNYFLCDKCHSSVCLSDIIKKDTLECTCGMGQMKKLGICNRNLKHKYIFKILGWKCQNCGKIHFPCSSCLRNYIIYTICPDCGYDASMDGNRSLKKITIISQLKISIIIGSYLNIILGKLGMIRRDRMTEFDRRLHICKKCEGQRNNICNYCGCPIFPKSRSPFYKGDGCPIRKW